MNDKHYNNYQDAYEHESLKLLVRQQEELEMRKKLEESLNILAMFAIIAIIILVLLKVLTVFGIVGAVSTASEIVGGFLNRLL